MANVTIPASPPAPTSFELGYADAAAMSVSPFTGQQQVQYWNVLPRILSVSFIMKPSDAPAWKTFLTALNGVVNTFTFTSAFGTAYPEIGTRVWRLRGGVRKLSVSSNRTYGVSLDLIEAL